VEGIKAINGHRWLPDGKYWRFPDTNGKLEKILKVFEGEKIYLEPPLQFKVSKLVIADDDIKNYLFYLAEEKQFATSTLNQAINALKFYYGIMLKRNLSMKSNDLVKKKTSHSL